MYSLDQGYAIGTSNALLSDPGGLDDDAINLGVSFHTSNMDQQGASLRSAHECKSSLKEVPVSSREFHSSSIVRAIASGSDRNLLGCLKHKGDPGLTCPLTGQTLMHAVLTHCCEKHQNSYLAMVYLLSNYGSKVNAEDKSGLTPVRLAIKKKHVPILRALLKCGAEVTPNDRYEVSEIQGMVKQDIEETFNRLTPSYWSAVLDPQPFKVMRLVRAWSRVNIVNNQGLTLIEFAKQTKGIPQETVEELVKNEASIELAHAVMAGDVDKVNMLVCDHAADLDTRDTSEKDNYFESYAPLTLDGAAIKLGHQDLLTLLREARNAKESGGGECSKLGSSVSNAVVVSAGFKNHRPYLPSQKVPYESRTMRPTVPTSKTCTIL